MGQSGSWCTVTSMAQRRRVARRRAARLGRISLAPHGQVPPPLTMARRLNPSLIASGALSGDLGFQDHETFALQGCFSWPVPELDRLTHRDHRRVGGKLSAESIARNRMVS